MALKTLQDLFVNELKDVYSAEKQILQALPKMAKAASSPDLRRAFETHRKQTQDQVTRLDKIFEQLGASARGKKCKGMEGLLAEGTDIMEDEGEEAVIDAGLIASRKPRPSWRRPFRKRNLPINCFPSLQTAESTRLPSRRSLSAARRSKGQDLPGPLELPFQVGDGRPHELLQIGSVGRMHRPPRVDPALILDLPECRRDPDQRAGRAWRAEPQNEAARAKPPNMPHRHEADAQCPTPRR